MPLINLQFQTLEIEEEEEGAKHAVINQKNSLTFTFKTLHM